MSATSIKRALAGVALAAGSVVVIAPQLLTSGGLVATVRMLATVRVAL